MDEGGAAPLVGAHGHCSLELVNLALTGAATSNAFDGGRDLGGGAALRGVCARPRVGLLSLHEWYGYLEVGDNLKSPEAPVWVVAAESHFTTLFLAPSRASGGSGGGGGDAWEAWAAARGRVAPPLVLGFYDGLSRQGGPIWLDVAPAPGRGWASRLEGAADRGSWEGRPVPPLECVVETRWRDVAVGWRGSEPLL
ncbi:MAG: hypothetical protein J3K34DRAFT_375322 [Monoraphidium minutum]|nr:MAG: hypothetical protein J3K34DRAFT_375322 [Monoraphidium minutum]